MSSRKNYNSIFLICFITSAIVLALWKTGVLNTPAGLISKIFSKPREVSISQLFNNKNSDLAKLSRSLDLAKIEKENQALRDQFAVSSPSPSSIIPAQIIGAPSLVPGSSAPTQFILDKGESDGVKTGQAVILENNLVGQISQVSESSSKVTLVNNKSVSFTGKTQNGALGVVKGLGDLLVINNILLSENVEKESLVLTKGDQDINRLGIPPDLVVGAILSVDKDPSALFQKAEIKSLVDFNKISTVFIVIK